MVGSDWIRGIHDVFDDGDVDLVAGRILPDLAGPPPSWLRLSTADGLGRLASPLGLVDYGPNRQALGARAAVGGNLIIRRSTFEAIGGFPRHLGKLRGTLLSGEDHALSERVVAGGYRAIYEPTITVLHLVPVSRMRLSYFLRWFFWSGLTHGAIDVTREGARASRHRLAFYHLRQAVRALGTAARAAIGGRRTVAVEGATEAAFSIGYVWARWKPGRRPWLPESERQAEAA
jgi:GT2 family glycosyltransferase